MIYILLFTSLVLQELLLFLLFYLRFRHMQREHRAALERVSRRMEEAMAAPEASPVDGRQEIMGRLRAEIAGNAPARRALAHGERLAFDKSLYGNVLHCDSEEHFFRYMDERCNRIVTKLSAVTALNNKEIMLACLYLLEIPDNDILTLTGYSPRSLPNTKHRLARKLGLTSVSRLREFLVDLAS